MTRLPADRIDDAYRRSIAAMTFGRDAHVLVNSHRLRASLLAVPASVVVAVAVAAVFAPTIRVEIARDTIVAEEGRTFVAPLPFRDNWVYRLPSDSSEAPTASTLQLYEGPHTLGPAHAQHADIRALGGGLFSHWDRSIRFSSSDGTDPRANNRVYRAEARLSLQPPWIAAGTLALATLGLALAFLVWRRGARAAARLRRTFAPDWAGASSTGARRAVLLGLASCCFALAAAVAYLGLSAPTVVFAVPSRAVGPEIGFAYLAPIPDLGSLYEIRGDDRGDRGSSVELFEEGRKLGPAHAQHAHIRSLGGGRYSHWGDFVRFSTSDNSNPLTNGRRYDGRAASTLATPWSIVGWAAFLLGLVLAGSWLGTSTSVIADRAIRTPLAWLSVPFDASVRVGVAIAVAAGIAGGAAVVLAWMAGSGTQIGLELGRFLPLSDAYGYHHCGTLLAAWGGLDWEYCGRRMLYISMLSSLFSLLGWSTQNALIAQGVLIGLAAAVLVLQVARVISRVAAAVVAVMAVVFAWEMTLGVFMTEVAGYVMGALAFALLFAFSQTKRRVWLFAGMACFSVAMVARAGALSAVPAAVIWAAFVFRRDPDRAAWKNFAIALVGAAFGPALQFLEAWVVGLDPSNAGGNYSTVLYGLSTGSRMFSEAHEKFHDVFATQGESAAFKAVYAAAFRNIAEHPEVFVHSLWLTLQDFWHSFFSVGVLSSWSIWLRMLFIAGLVRCALSWRSVPAASLLLLVSAAEFAVAPLIAASEAVRVYTATTMVRWVVCGVGLDWLVNGLARVVTHRPVVAVQPAPGGVLPKLAFGTGLVVVALMVFPMLPLYPRLERFPLTGRCAPGLDEVIARIGNESVMMTITSGPEKLVSLDPFRIGFTRLSEDPDYYERWYGPEVVRLRPPLTILRIVDRTSVHEKTIWPVVYEGELANSESPRVLCVDRSTSVSIASHPHFLVRDIQPGP